jgi:hypothetical protein
VPYVAKKVGDQYCIYKKDSGKKVGCTDGTEEAKNKYLAALHINAKEGVNNKLNELRTLIKKEVMRALSTKL